MFDNPPANNKLEIFAPLDVAVMHLHCVCYTLVMLNICNSCFKRPLIYLSDSLIHWFFYMGHFLAIDRISLEANKSIVE